MLLIPSATIVAFFLKDIFVTALWIICWSASLRKFPQWLFLSLPLTIFDLFFCTSFFLTTLEIPTTQFLLSHKKKKAMILDSMPTLVIIPVFTANTAKSLWRVVCSLSSFSQLKVTDFPPATLVKCFSKDTNDDLVTDPVEKFQLLSCLISMQHVKLLTSSEAFWPWFSLLCTLGFPFYFSLSPSP